MTHRILLPWVTAVTLLGAQASCLPDDEYREGAMCSASLTCPPDQRCSTYGMCLRRCPTPDCTGASCGCEDYDTHGNPSKRYLCLEDGLCHIQCDDYGGCDDQQLCNQADGICHPDCSDLDCPPDSTCGPDGYCIE